MAEDNTTTYTTPFGKEVNRRRAHLDGLPGKVHHERYESMNRASMVFAGNSRELERHLSQFTGAPVFATELSDDFAAEAARLLHNYLAALGTLRDVQRAIHRQLWPDRQDPKDQQTIWEATVWAPKIAELFSDDDAMVFLVDLRNFIIHYAIPHMATISSFKSASGKPGGPMAFNNTVAVDRKELLKWNGWKEGGRRYIEAQEYDNIDIVTVIATYSTRVRDFYGWFWEQIESAVRIEVNEYRNKSLEYSYWVNLEEIVSRFGPPDSRHLLQRELAKGRLERAKFGTSGWRLITLDDNGEWVVGERDPGWPPLPPGPR